jgi:ligand-binding sensor domain-containing protein
MRATLWVLSVAAASPLVAQSRHWTERERVIVTEFRRVQAVAASDIRVFVVTAEGLGLYDRRFQRWEAPVTQAEGFPREPVLAALADPADDAVWLGTPSGLLLYRPLFRQFESYIIPGGVRGFAYDRGDPFRGIYLRTASGWEFLPRGSFMPGREPLPPPGRRGGTISVEEVLAREPVVEAMRAAVLVDDRLRTLRWTAAAAVPNTDEYYLGTDDGGVVRFDALSARFEPLPFGLLSPGAGAVLAVPGGVWVGTDGRGARGGLTFVSDDLQRYGYEEGPRGTSFGGFAVRALMIRGREIWAATEAGVARVVPEREFRRLSRANGLPDDDVYALAQGPSGVWIGTAVGLGFLADGDDEVHWSGGPPVPVLTLSAARDTAWVGMTAGLGLVTPGGDILVPRGWDSVPEMREAIVAVTRVADTLVAATVDRILWKAPGDGWRVERSVGPHAGAIYALAPDQGGVWVGGRNALVRFGFLASDLRVFRVPGDIPGPIRGISVDPRYLWLATEGGLVRFERSALTP